MIMVMAMRLVSRQVHFILYTESPMFGVPTRFSLRGTSIRHQWGRRLCVAPLRPLHSTAGGRGLRNAGLSDGGGWSSWRWFKNPWIMGVTCLVAVQLVRTLPLETHLGTDEDPVTWQLNMFRLLPTRGLSRSWGYLTNLELPLFLRQPLLGLYVWLFDCQMEEAVMEDLRSYKSLVQLFTRRLKEGTRPISSLSELVCPSDGKVLHFGKVEANGRLEQVKGVTYHLDKFLGTGIVEKSVCSSSGPPSGKMYQEHGNQTQQLYHIILYLAPGDYHHFHSPAEWSALIRRHFPGELLTVAPWAARVMPSLFALNERVVLSGCWQHGFFSFTAVGAYNVGSIEMAIDKSLQTNVKGHYKMGDFYEQRMGNASGLAIRKGERVGNFNLGSSVVLVFEAPEDFEFAVEAGQVVKCGQPLGRCP